jgi:dTDP-4-dehydrorhamnose reductase
VSDTTIIGILGASGMLGSSLVSRCETDKKPHVRGAFSHPDVHSYAKVDIRDAEALQFFIDSWRPSVIINASAYTNVDGAETEYASALDINARGVRILAEVCRKNDIYLLHVSTDYVFGGEKHSERPQVPFRENEENSPVGMYGYSKLLGEMFIRSVYPENSLIVRTSWLHGRGGKNFIDTISRLSLEKDELRVVNDQIGSLTWTTWLSEVLLDLAEKRMTGVLHASAYDAGSWYDVAQYIVEKNNAACRILPQSTLESGRPAPRPGYSKLSTDSLEEITGLRPPSWREFVDLHLADVGE